MKTLFNWDNPFIQFLGRIGDMIIANFLFLVCCFPVFTIGASITALSKVMQDIVREVDSSTVKTFFRAFKENFKQATIAWLVVLLFLVAMVCNFLLISFYFSGTAMSVLNWILFAVICMMCAIASYLFPLIARYQNTLKEHVMNAGILAIIKLPRTLAMVLLNMLPFLIMYFSMNTFVKTLAFWLSLGFSVINCICSWLLLPVFKEMEAPGGPNMRIMN